MSKVGISKHGDLDFSPLRVRHVVGQLFRDVAINIFPIVVVSRVVRVVRHPGSELDSTLFMAFKEPKNLFESVHMSLSRLCSESTHCHACTHDVDSA